MALPGVMNKCLMLEGTSKNQTMYMFDFKQPLQVLEFHFLSSKTEMTEQPCKIEIETLLAEVKPYEQDHFIFKVPRSLRKLEPDAYVPHVVSIGPYHMKDEYLRKMENHKLQVLKHFLQRTQLPLDFLVDRMSQLEESTRNCYDKPIEGIGKQQFVKMMLLDSCFILELLNSYDNGCENQTNTSEWWNLTILRGFLPFIQRDLLMLENQLPLSVLADLASLTWYPTTTAWQWIANRALKFFQSLIPGIYETPTDCTINDELPLHLLDFVHQILEPNGYEEQRSQKKERSRDKKKYNEHDHHQQQLNSEIPSHSITRLRGMGVSFKKGGSAKITDINFDGGKCMGVSFKKRGRSKITDIKFEGDKLSLIIPPLRIRSSTKSIFLNLMAFEQCYRHCKSYVTSYISFMDGLIDSPKDVEHLHRQGIIVHDLGSEDEVASLFNNLRKEIVFDPRNSYLSHISEQLNKTYEQKWRTWKATLKHEYLKDPWKIISIVAASFLILLTFAQTFYTMLAYHRPSS